MEPEKYLSSLLKECSPTKQRTLKNIFEVCSDILNTQQRDFSIAHVARIGRGRGVPAAQSIRNEKTKVYQNLIKYFADLEEVKKTKKISSESEAWINEIEDPRLRLLANMQAAENSRLKSKLNEIIAPSSVISIIDNSSVENFGDRILTRLEKNALEYLISKEFMDKWNFKESESGHVLDMEGNEVFKIGTVDAINKALEYLR